MKTISVLFIFFLMFNYSFSQSITFEKWYDYGFAESGRCVQQTSDGGFIVAGRQGIGLGSSNYLLVKTDSLGNELWHRSFGSPGDNELNAIKQTFDGGYIVTGQTSGTQANRYDVSWIKLSSNGSSVWSKKFTPPPPDYIGTGTDVIQTVDSGYAILANINDTIGANITNAGLLIKTSMNGDTLWTKKFKYRAGIVTNSIKLTSDSGFIIVGTIALTTGPFSFNVYLIKTDSNGDTLWTKAISTSNNYEGAYNIAVLDSGGFFIRGKISYVSTSTFEIYLLKVSNNGDTVWTNTLCPGCGGTGADKKADGGFVISGSVGRNNASYVYLASVDELGDTVWTKTFGNGQNNVDAGFFVQTTSDGGCVVTGESGDGSSVYLIKTDSLGNVVISVDELLIEENSIVVYPNPFNDEATILLSENTKNKSAVELRLLDMLGRTMAETKFNPSMGSIKFQRNKLVSGVYLLQLFSNEKLIASKKIVIQ